jgi:hypothetical protein
MLKVSKMKQKGMLAVYIITAVLLAHVILVVGCGKNPLIGSLGSSMSVGIGRL